MGDQLRQHADWLLQLAREPRRSARDRSSLLRERRRALKLLYMTEPAALRADLERMQREVRREWPELERWLREELRRLNE